jgi:hypothetical protein
MRLLYKVLRKLQSFQQKARVEQEKHLLSNKMKKMKIPLYNNEKTQQIGMITLRGI